MCPALAAVDWRPAPHCALHLVYGRRADLRGSRAYVAAHQDELDRVVAMINIDMPGSPRALWTSGPPQFVERLQQFRRGMAGYLLNEDIGRLSGTWSDHAPFVEAGVCGVTLGGELGPGGRSYHTANDKFECVDQRARSSRSGTGGAGAATGRRFVTQARQMSAGRASSKRTNSGVGNSISTPRRPPLTIMESSASRDSSITTGSLRRIANGEIPPTL